MSHGIGICFDVKVIFKRINLCNKIQIRTFEVTDKLEGFFWSWMVQFWLKYVSRINVWTADFVKKGGIILTFEEIVRIGNFEKFLKQSMAIGLWMILKY